MNAVLSPEQIEPDPIDLDPRPCGECGLTIDRHLRIDTPEGPEFFCDVDSDADFQRDDIVRRWELADPRDRWKHTGEPPPEAADSPTAKKPYRTADSTIAAFKYVLSLNDADHLGRWLADHPADAAELLKNWKDK